MKKFFPLAQTFIVPLIIIGGIGAYGIFYFLHVALIANSIILLSILLGTYNMLKETVQSLRKKQFALDYIAIIAILVAIVTKQYLVAAILALMIATGRTLEAYGVSQAKRSLTRLIDRIPTDVLFWEMNKPGKKGKIDQVQVGDTIFI